MIITTFLLTEIDLFNFMNSFFVRLFLFLLWFVLVLLSTSTCLSHIIYSVSYLDILSSIVPFIILLYIIHPVFLLLYQLELIKFPTSYLETLGNQWYWSYFIQLEDWWWCFDNPFYLNDFLSLSLDDTIINSLSSSGKAICDSYDMVMPLIPLSYQPVDVIPTAPIVKGDFNFSQSLIPTLNYLISDSYLFSVNNLLLLPLFETINTIVTSVDVIHCWSIYSIGSKIDAIPGRLNLTFTLRLFNRGMNRGFCYELCGQGHYGMQIISATLFLLFSMS